MPDLLISYLYVKDIITLCHVSKPYRKFILKKFRQTYISTGFCSLEQWFLIIKRSCFALIDDIFNQSFFDEVFFNYHFDFKENFFQLKKKYRNLLLFFICLHFLSCVRSCDKRSHYCKICSRFRDYHFVETNAYGNLMVCFSTKILDLTTSHRIDLDVFLLNAEYNLGFYTKDKGFCTFFQTFDYAQDFFAAFSGI